MSDKCPICGKGSSKEEFENCCSEECLRQKWRFENQMEVERAKAEAEAEARAKWEAEQFVDRRR